jgi:hypothetical protein
MQLSGLLAYMNTYWIGFGQYGNMAFWQYEWSAHGFCSGFTVRDYFDKTCNLFGVLTTITPIEEAFKKNGLIYISFAFLFLNSCVFLINIKIAVFFFFLLCVTGINPSCSYPSISFKTSILDTYKLIPQFICKFDLLLEL